MASIPELYSLHHSSSSGGVEGYHVEKKYYDPAKMKQERILSQSKEKSISAKPVNVSKKTSFIDDIQKKQAKLPGPTSYESKIQERARASSQIIKHPDRKTFIDQLAQHQRKKHVPGAGTYQLDTEADKNKKSNLSRAESPTYLEACMRNSLDCPGVGNYNAHRAVFDHRGNRWVDDPEKGKKKQQSTKLPPVGTYNPSPVSYRLFDSTANTQKPKNPGGLGGKSERWKTSKQKKLPFYNVLSEWGMKDKRNKKDILTKISSHPNTHRSVYY